MAKDFLVDNETLYNIEYGFVKYFGYILLLAHCFYLVGVSISTPSIILQISFWLKVTVGLFLVYRFNSWRSDSIRFTDLDRSLCNSAGIYIIALSFSDVFVYYLEQIRSIITPFTLPIIHSIERMGYNDIDKIENSNSIYNNNYSTTGHTCLIGRCAH